jgi:hypothetical protein
MKGGTVRRRTVPTSIGREETRNMDAQIGRRRTGLDILLGAPLACFFDRTWPTGEVDVVE